MALRSVILLSKIKKLRARAIDQFRRTKRGLIPIKKHTHHPCLCLSTILAPSSPFVVMLKHLSRADLPSMVMAILREVPSTLERVSRWSSDLHEGCEVSQEGRPHSSNSVETGNKFGMVKGALIGIHFPCLSSDPKTRLDIIHS